MSIGSLGHVGKLVKIKGRSCKLTICRSSAWNARRTSSSRDPCFNLLLQPFHRCLALDTLTFSSAPYTFNGSQLRWLAHLSPSKPCICMVPFDPNPDPDEHFAQGGTLSARSSARSTRDDDIPTRSMADIMGNDNIRLQASFPTRTFQELAQIGTPFEQIFPWQVESRGASNALPMMYLYACLPLSCGQQQRVPCNSSLQMPFLPCKQSSLF